MGWASLGSRARTHALRLAAALASKVVAAAGGNSLLFIGRASRRSALNERRIAARRPRPVAELYFGYVHLQPSAMLIVLAILVVAQRGNLFADSMR